jgi:hypothetical protein
MNFIDVSRAAWDAVYCSLRKGQETYRGWQEITVAEWK